MSSAAAAMRYPSGMHPRIDYPYGSEASRAVVRAQPT